MYISFILANLRGDNLVLQSLYDRWFSLRTEQLRILLMLLNYIMIISSNLGFIDWIYPLINIVINFLFLIKSVIVIVHLVVYIHM